MNESRETELEDTASRVADETSVDWLAETGEHPELSGALAGLRGLERLASAHREARLASGEATREALGASTPRPHGASESASAAPLMRASDREPSFTWGFLRVLDRIGAGSFGEVWRAWDPTLEREIALKLRRLEPVAPGETALAQTSDPTTRRWLEEARRLASIRHPNVLAVYGAADHEGRAGLWTELLRGETLEQRLKRDGPLEPREVARIGRDLCEALRAVHAAGLVHGDIKASNVMLESEADAAQPARVVLMDFGTARPVADGATSAPLTSAGTPLVMAPEVLLGHAATTRSDLYSLGALLYRLLAGRHPIEARSFEALRAAHESGTHTPLASQREGLPPRLIEAVERSLSHDPVLRPADARELGRSLSAVAEPLRGRMARVIAAGSAVAAVGAIVIAAFALQRPARVRYVPPEALPGPQVDAMRVVDTLVGGTVGERLSNSIAGVGDVNGDGLGDVVVGSTHFSATLDAQGKIALYLGNREGRFGKPAWVATGSKPLEHFGGYLAPAGDVNHDGHADLLETEFATRDSDRREVRIVSLYLGTSTGFESQPASRILEHQAESSFGIAMTGLGDVNGDGYGDVALGAFNFTHRFPYEGAVFVFYGGAHGLAPRPGWVQYGGAEDAWLGNRLSRTGDVNGDGYDDLLLGAYGWHGPKTPSLGRAMLYLGGPKGLAETPVWTAVGDQSSGEFGYMVGGVGDVNADRCDDFVVMQPKFSRRGVSEGRALLYLGSPNGPGRRPVWTMQGYSSDAQISSAAPEMGDVNGDGIPDIGIRSGAYSAAADRRQIGVVGVYLSPRDPRRVHPAWYFAGTDPGTPVARWDVPVGDFNGDGLADLVVGQQAWPGNDNRGRAFLFLGQRIPLSGGRRPGR